MRLLFYLILSGFVLQFNLFAQGNAMQNLYELNKAQTRSISPENFTGKKVKEAWQR